MPETLNIIVRDSTTGTGQAPRGGSTGGGGTTRTTAGRQQAQNIFSRLSEFSNETGNATVAMRAMSRGGIRAMGSFVASMGRLGPVIGALAVTVGGTVIALEISRRLAIRANAAIQRQVDELARISGPVAIAQSRTQVGRERGLIDRGRRIGEDVAAVERTRSLLEGELDNLRTSILDGILGATSEVVPVLSLISVIVSELSRRVDGVVTFLDASAESFAGNPNSWIGEIIRDARALVEISKAVEDMLEQTQRGNVDEFTQEFIDTFFTDGQGGRVRRVQEDVD